MSGLQGRRRCQACVAGRAGGSGGAQRARACLMAGAAREAARSLAPHCALHPGGRGAPYERLGGRCSGLGLGLGAAGRARTCLVSASSAGCATASSSFTSCEHSAHTAPSDTWRPARASPRGGRPSGGGSPLSSRRPPELLSSTSERTIGSACLSGMRGFQLLKLAQMEIESRTGGRPIAQGATCSALRCQDTGALCYEPQARACACSALPHGGHVSAGHRTSSICSSKGSGITSCRNPAQHSLSHVWQMLTRAALGTGNTARCFYQPDAHTPVPRRFAAHRQPPSRTGKPPGGAAMQAPASGPPPAGRA